LSVSVCEESNAVQTMKPYVGSVVQFVQRVTVIVADAGPGAVGRKPTWIVQLVFAGIGLPCDSYFCQQLPDCVSEKGALGLKLAGFWITTL
jgi:hypothetical protein